MLSGAAATTVSVRGTVATDGVGTAESVASKVTLNVPETVGVPW